MCPVVHQARNVVFGHFRQLLLKDALEAGQDDGALAVIVVVDDTELDLSIAFFDDSGLAPNQHTEPQYISDLRIRPFQGMERASRRDVGPWDRQGSRAGAS